MEKKTTGNKKIPISSRLSIAPNFDNSTQNDMERLVGRWLVYGRSEGHSKRTLQHYRELTDKFLWWWSDQTHYDKSVGHPNNVTEEHLRDFFAYLREDSLAFRWGKPVIPGKEKLSARTIKGFGMVLKTFFNWLEDENQIDVSPFTRRVTVVTKKGPVQTRHHKNLSKEQIDKIFARLKEPARLKKYNGVRDLAIVATLLGSGIRRGELLSMRVRDLDLDTRRISVTGKSGPRTVFIEGAAYNALVLYKKQWRNQQDQSPATPFWLCSDGMPLSYDGLGSVVKELGNSLGFTLGTHTFRHTFATHMVSKVGIYELKEMLGHTKVTTTEIYTHGSLDKLQDKYRGNSPLSDMELNINLGVKRRRGRPKKEETLTEENEE